MIDDFMHVLENYTGANLHSVAARKVIAEALVQHMCDHHIVTFTNYEAAVNDPNMKEFIKNCGCNPTKEDIPVKRGL